MVEWHTLRSGDVCCLIRNKVDTGWVKVMSDGEKKVKNV